MTKWYAKIALYSYEEMSAEMHTESLAVFGDLADTPNQALKSVAHEGFSSLELLNKVKVLTTGNCNHECGCRGTFCCVCDFNSKQDDQAYNAGYYCLMVPKKEAANDKI